VGVDADGYWKEKTPFATIARRRRRNAEESAIGVACFREGIAAPKPKEEGIW